MLGRGLPLLLCRGSLGRVIHLLVLGHVAGTHWLLLLHHHAWGWHLLLVMVFLVFRSPASAGRFLLLLLRCLLASTAVHLLDDALHTLLIGGLAVGNVIALDLV